jgi:DNA polymerase-3 subunit beta
MVKVIDLQYPARCSDCGAELAVGTAARYYGRGRIYGLECHGRPDDGPTVKEEAATELAELARSHGVETGPVVPVPDGAEDPFGATSEAAREMAARMARADVKVAAASSGPWPPAGSVPTFEPGPGNPYRPKKETGKKKPASKPAARPKKKERTPGAVLLEAVKRAAKGISTRPGIPALAGIMVERTADGYTFTATDLELTVRTGAAVGSVDGPDEGWRALVSGRAMVDALTAVKSADRFTFGPSDGATFTIGAATIRTLAADDFPKVAELEHHWGTWPAAELVAAIGAVFPHTSKDEARPVLTGILVDSEGRLAATDSYSLAVVDVPGAEPSGLGVEHFLLPGRALKLAAGIIGKRAEGTVRILTATAGADNAAVLLILPDGSRVQSRVIEGEFPNYRQLIPEPGENRLETGTELEDVIRAAAPFARESSPVRLELNALGARVTATSPDLGEYVGTVPAEYRGEELSIAFNPAYLLRTLAVAPGAELEIRDGLKPACVRADGRIGLVMPVRLPVPVG